MIYTDDRTNDNNVFDVIEDFDGNYVYVGACASNGEEYHGNGFITKISPEGKFLLRHIEYSADSTFSGHDNDLRFQRIFLTKNGTYFVIGSKIVEGDGFVIALEFDKNFNVLLRSENLITEGIGTEIHTMAKQYGDGQYVLSICYVRHVPGENWRILGAVAKMDKEGKLSVFKSVPDFDYKNHFACNIISVRDGEMFLLIDEGGCVLFDSNLEAMEVKSFKLGTYTSARNDGIAFNNGDVLYFNRFYDKSFKNPWALEIVKTNVYDLDNPSRLQHRFGADKTTTKDAFLFNGLMRSCDYITEDNLVFGANFNHISNGSYTQSHALIPTVLGVGSYDIAEDKINWEGYYKDDINCYCMASICDTKDGGAIVAATKASFDQAINYLSDIVLLKFSKGPSDIEDKSTCLNVNVYPNPSKK